MDEGVSEEEKSTFVARCQEGAPGRVPRKIDQVLYTRTATAVDKHMQITRDEFWFGMTKYAKFKIKGLTGFGPQTMKYLELIVQRADAAVAYRYVIACKLVCKIQGTVSIPREQAEELERQRKVPFMDRMRAKLKGTEIDALHIPPLGPDSRPRAGILKRLIS